MGYYTYYTLETIENKYKVFDIISYMKEQYDNSSECKYYAFQYEFESLLEDDYATYFELYSDECKWYEHDEEMIELSLKFPDTVFCLHGEGEESGDIWNKYYKNGKSQYCPARIVYDEYDETKLA